MVLICLFIVLQTALSPKIGRQDISIHCVQREDATQTIHQAVTIQA